MAQRYNTCRYPTWTIRYRLRSLEMFFLRLTFWLLLA